MLHNGIDHIDPSRPCAVLRHVPFLFHVENDSRFFVGDLGSLGPVITCLDAVGYIIGVQACLSVFFNLILRLVFFSIVDNIRWDVIFSIIRCCLSVIPFFTKDVVISILHDRNTPFPSVLLIQCYGRLPFHTNQTTV